MLCARAHAHTHTYRVGCYVSTPAHTHTHTHTHIVPYVLSLNNREWDVMRAHTHMYIYIYIYKIQTTFSFPHVTNCFPSHWKITFPFQTYYFSIYLQFRTYRSPPKKKKLHSIIHFTISVFHVNNLDLDYRLNQ